MLLLKVIDLKKMLLWIISVADGFPVLTDDFLSQEWYVDGISHFTWQKAGSMGNWIDYIPSFFSR